MKIITVQPDSSAFWWTVAVQLFNAKEIGVSQYFNVIIFLSHDRLHEGFSGKWKYLENKFPEVKFFYYTDTDNITGIFSKIGYVPLLRPWCLKKHWENFPELEEETIFYIDSDVVFTKFPDYIFEVENNEINYASPANNYTNASYFDSKIKDVLPEKLEEYKLIDVLDECANLVGINREIVEKHNEKSGAAQYLLKGVSADFWQKVLNNSIKIKLYLENINKKYFESEDKGFQSWCADIWATVWLIWEQNLPYDSPEELKFSWATSNI